MLKPLWRSGKGDRKGDECNGLSLQLLHPPMTNDINHYDNDHNNCQTKKVLVNPLGTAGRHIIQNG